MFDLDQWKTFSHTHRSFDFEETLSKDIVDGLKNSVESVADQFHEILFIEDKSVIEEIYDLSELPKTDQFKFKNFINRKNSQLLAPLVIIAIPKKYDNTSLFVIGEIYSQLAHRSIRQGMQTGFCICYDNAAVESLLEQKKYTKESRRLFQIPFLSIGHQIKGIPWNFQQRDINMTVNSFTKIDASTYITIS